MQKNVVFSAVMRGMIIGLSALFVFILGLWTLRVMAESDCAFCDVLNKILVSKNWENAGDGTVVNANALGWIEASRFVTYTGTEQKCPNDHQCVIGFTSSGQILCSK